MNEADAKNLIARYARSYFHDDSAEGWFESHDAGNKIGSRVIGGSKVPILRDRDLTAAMIENVEESRRAIKDTADRLHRARLDGLLDRDAFASLSKKTKAAWLAAVQVVKGDYQRAVAESKQWQEYAEMASEGTLPTLKHPGGIGDIVRQLADAKSIEPDRRLPPEPEDEEVPF